MISSASANERKHIDMSGPVLPPYLYLNDKQQQAGQFLDVLDCVFDSINYSYQITFLPPLRSLRSLQNGNSQAALLVSSNVEQRYRQNLSAPLLLQKWYWFYLSNGHSFATLMDSRTQAPLAILRGSGAKRLLNQQQADNLLEVSLPSQLPALLLRNRVVAVLSDEQVFLEALKQNGIDHQQVKRKFLKYFPIGILFNENLMAQQPRIISQVNSHLDHCSQARQLSLWESEKLTRFAESRYKLLFGEARIESELLNLSTTASMSDILEMDRKWRAEVKNHRYQLIEELMNKPLSKQLEQWQASQSGYITEVLVTGPQGELVAMSQVTSDYWQGDEDKVKRILAGQDPYLSDIHYDNSTQQFQAQISYGVRHKTTNKLIGTLTLGLDIEKILLK